MATWKASRVSAEFAENVQVEAGTLLSTFDVTDPVAPDDSDIICATTGDFSITCVPETEDFFADVNNVPNNTMEGKRITGWNCGLTVNCLEVTEATLKLALGAARVNTSGGITPKANYTTTDFKTLYWIGDMVDDTKLFVVVLRNTVSTGGLSLTTSKNGKGTIALTLTPHASINNIEDIPMDFYVLEKDDGQTVYTYTAASPVGSENPSALGWYVLNGDTYIMSNDTAVDSNKTYYVRSTT